MKAYLVTLLENKGPGAVIVAETPGKARYVLLRQAWEWLDPDKTLSFRDVRVRRLPSHDVLVGRLIPGAAANKIYADRLLAEHLRKKKEEAVK